MSTTMLHHFATLRISQLLSAEIIRDSLLDKNISIFDFIIIVTKLHCIIILDQQF